LKHKTSVSIFGVETDISQ